MRRLLLACLFIMSAACVKDPANPPPSYVAAEQSAKGAEKALGKCVIVTALGDIATPDPETITVDELKDCWSKLVSAVKAAWDAHKEEQQVLKELQSVPVDAHDAGSPDAK